MPQSGKRYLITWGQQQSSPAVSIRGLLGQNYSNFRKHEHEANISDAQAKVTSKRKQIFQYIHVWHGNFVIPKATDGFLGHPCLMTRVSEWLSEPESCLLLRMEGALVEGHWRSSIQPMNSQVNQRTKKVHRKVSLDCTACIGSMIHPQNPAWGVICALLCLMMHLVCWSFLGVLQPPVIPFLLLFISAEKWRICCTAALQAGAGDHRTAKFLYSSSFSHKHLEPFHTNSIQCQCCC